MLRIIFTDKFSKTEAHAKQVIRKLAENERLNSESAYRLLIGVAGHTAQYPSRCDECGQTYWSADPYAAHPGCGGFKRGLGF